MKHIVIAEGSFGAVSNPRTGMSSGAGFTVWLAAAIGVLCATALPARGAQVTFTELVISTAADNATSVFATDVDGDGDVDILSASHDDNKIAWYENDGGSPPNFTERVISTNAQNAFSVFATDVDGDGDTDVLSASSLDDKIAWYENDGGSPPSFTERVISTTADLAFSVFATDLDGDGDTDVLSGEMSNNKIAWYENDGGSPPTFTERVIFSSTSGSGVVSVFATDVDGDGDTDVLSASAVGNKIAWYESDGGSPPTFTERVISTNAVFAISVFATDVDGDGDTDVLSASRLDNKIAWYENNGGSPPSFTERVISTTADSAISVFATDVDGDGDTDVLSASNNDHKIAWYENDGSSPPSFSEQVISTAAQGASSVFASDVDGDGDTDILSASQNIDKISWYENTSPTPDAPLAGASTFDRALEIILPASSAGTNTAYRVTLVTLYDPANPQPVGRLNYSAIVGQVRYLNVLRDSGGNMVTDCVSSSASGTTYPCISVGCDPEFADWGTMFGGVTAYVSGNAIIPDSAYTVAHLDSSCVGMAATCTSASAEVAFTTARYGDAQPDGMVTVADVVLTVDVVKQLPGSLFEYHVYVRKENPAPQDDAVNVGDIVAHVDALKLFAYNLPITSPCP